MERANFGCPRCELPRMLSLSPAREKRFGFPHLLPFDVGMLSQIEQLGIILGGFRSVAGRGGGARDPQDPAIAIGCRLERRLVGSERCGAVTRLEQEVAVK